MPESLAWLFLVAMAVTLLFLLPFATHRSYLLLVVSRKKHRIRGASGEVDGRITAPREGEEGALLPRVTVQLPVYNEPRVVERVIDAACRLDYPRDRFEVQVLDDSTDDTSAKARERVAFWRGQGVRIEHIRRSDRTGFKAGALAAGLDRASGEFLLVFDADFVPHPDFIHRLLPDFADPGVGMVQARWDHLNEEENLLTRVQALLLDGHFFFEQNGRYRNGCFFNFNGTGGIWRRSCLEDAGGWEADTLTEDLDLSYRAQMRGWRFVFREDVGVPAELPARARALEVQQKRWAQGGIQTARKLLPALLRANWPVRMKREAVVHLCGHLAHPLTLLLGLLIYPAAVARTSLGLERFLVLDLFIFGAATVPFLVFYTAAGRRRGGSWLRLLPTVVATLGVGIGLTAPVSRAVTRGLAGHQDPFVRTPKVGTVEAPRPKKGEVGRWSDLGDPLFKLGLGFTMAGFLAAAFLQGLYASVPFLLLFASGYLGMGIGGLDLRERFTNRVEDEEREEGGADRETHPERLGPYPGRVEGARAPVAREHEAGQENPSAASA